MPKHVDTEIRHEETLSAAYEILEEEGLQAVSFRSVSARMGGSATLVTHYYSSRRELIERLVAFAVERWKRELDLAATELEDPRERLRLLVVFLVPTAEPGLREERARVNLVANHWDDEEGRMALAEWGRYTRELLHRYLAPIADEADIERLAESLRITTNGLCYLAVQYPERWPRERLLAAVDYQLGLLGLSSAAPEGLEPSPSR